MKFVNRNSELNYLNKAYQSQDSNFVIIYGRRRVGKTRLIKEFIQNKPHIYFLCDKELEVDLLRRLQRSIASFLNDNMLEKIEFQNWETLFEYFLNHADFSQKLVFIIDEFPYVVKANSAFPSILQRLWDELLLSKNVFLILCGSLVHMMYNTTLSYTSPLYGRRTGQIRLEPITFLDFKEFFPGLNFQDLVEFYSVIGGVPKYIESITPDRNILVNIENSILNKNEYLYHEPRFILGEEVTEAMTYFSILRVIAEGEHKIGNIAGKLHLPTPNLTKYLETLIDLDILQRQVPITEEQPSKSKKGLYFIKDNFFRFWFYYIFPYQSQLELDYTVYVLKKIRSSFSQFISPVFESITQQLLSRWNTENLLPFTFEKCGRWWNRNQEIDLIALNAETKNILFCECKWMNKPIDLNVLNELKAKVKHVDWCKHDRNEYFLLMSKSGFTSRLIQVAQKEGVLLAEGFDLII